MLPILNKPRRRQRLKLAEHVERQRLQRVDQEADVDAALVGPVVDLLRLEPGDRRLLLLPLGLSGTTGQNVSVFDAMGAAQAVIRESPKARARSCFVMAHIMLPGARGG